MLEYVAKKLIVSGISIAEDILANRIKEKNKQLLEKKKKAAEWFTSVVSHVHWVYCAYILLQFNPPGVPEHINSLADKQRWIKAIINSKEKVRVFQLLTQINGAQRYKNELRQALEVI